jgi:hypothetical protein
MRALAASLLAAGCSSKESYTVASGPRDWHAHPAIVEVDGAAEIFAVSDVHGGYDRMAALFARHGLVPAVPPSPGAMRWSGGRAVLVVAGDLIDKGPQGVEVRSALMALEASATEAGGRVVVTLGNHEAEFFVDPTNSKASAFDDELVADRTMPLAIADGSDPRGKWLRDRPLAARVDRWFFSHAGDTGGRDVAGLEEAFELAMTAHDFDDPEIVGSSSLLESRDWTSDDGIGARYAAAVGADHLVFGHDPHALGPDGAIAAAQSGALVRIDCGMSPAVDYSQGALLHVRGGVVEALGADGSRTPLP